MRQNSWKSTWDRNEVNFYRNIKCDMIFIEDNKSIENFIESLGNVNKCYCLDTSVVIEIAG